MSRFPDITPAARVRQALRASSIEDGDFLWRARKPIGRQPVNTVNIAQRIRSNDIDGRAAYQLAASKIR